MDPGPTVNPTATQSAKPPHSETHRTEHEQTDRSKTNARRDRAKSLRDDADSLPSKRPESERKAQGPSNAGPPAADNAGGAPRQRMAPPSSSKSDLPPGGAPDRTAARGTAPAASEGAPALPVAEQRSPTSALVPALVAAAVVLLIVSVVVSSLIWGGSDRTTARTTASPSIVASSGSAPSGMTEETTLSPPMPTFKPGATSVTTTVGKLEGSTVSVDGVKLSQWLGVAYAESTAGERRFKKPVPLNVSDRSVVVDAVKPRPPCAQWVPGRGVVGNEDCLRLNIWAPADMASGAAMRSLVLAATGDWFQRGTNHVPQWEELAAKAGMVVMAPNTRLGVLGFLHLGNKGPKGIDKDVGEDDTMAAIQWAQDNAAAFGADPSALMLVGNGTGGYLLAQAAGKLKLNVSRAVFEGSLYTSMRGSYVDRGHLLLSKENDAETNIQRQHGGDHSYKTKKSGILGGIMPNELIDRKGRKGQQANGSQEPSKELATKLGCNESDPDTWLKCFSDASLEKLLSTAAAMELRFATTWDAFALIGFSNKKLPSINDAIAGGDVSQARTLIEEYIRPKAEANGSASTNDALLSFTARYLAGSFAKDVEKHLKGGSFDDTMLQLAAAVSGCGTRKAARQASHGYHYMVDSGSRPLFEPILSTAEVAQFLSQGKVPSLKEGHAWPPAKEGSRFLFTNGTEVTGSVKLCDELANLLG
ncbi:uncharacterized protein LOC144108557 [Amblyomma americanum]